MSTVMEELLGSGKKMESVYSLLQHVLMTLRFDTYFFPPSFSMYLQCLLDICVRILAAATFPLNASIMRSECD